MQKITLGRTGLEVSVAGLGCGGHSRLGQGTGASVSKSIRLVEAAIDLGITFLDTAQAYGTEEIVARGIGAKRDQVVLSTKAQIVQQGTSPLGDDLISADELKQRVETSLKRLGTDYVDILHLHGVMPGQYAHCAKELVPALYDLQRQGKIRFLALSERFIYDTSHDMLKQALLDDFFDVIMAGYNLINPSARKSVLPLCGKNNIGVLCMFAVRRALSNREALKQLMVKLDEESIIDASKLDGDDPLGFLKDEGGAESIIDGAYRFCRHTPNIHVVLTGTGSIEHLQQNITSINRGPLKPGCLEQLEAIFGDVESVSGE